MVDRELRNGTFFAYKMMILLKQTEDWRDEPWEYKNEQYEACGGTRAELFRLPGFHPGSEVFLHQELQ